MARSDLVAVERIKNGEEKVKKREREKKKEKEKEKEKRWRGGVR